MSGKKITHVFRNLTFLKNPLGITSVPVPGKVTVIECWASWCGPCVMAFPHLSELQKKYEAKGLVICGVTEEAATPALKRFVEGQGAKMSYAVAADQDNELSEHLMGPFNVQGIPHAFVVDPQGVIQYSGHPAAPDFEQTIVRSLNQIGQEDVRQKPATIPIKVTQSKEELSRAPVKELKAILDSHHVSYADLHEKPELVQRILEKCVTGV